MPGIDPERLLADLRSLRSIGAHGRGVVRPDFTAAGMEARRWLAHRYQEDGLVAMIDGVGNVPGRQVLADAAAAIPVAANARR